MTDNDKPLIFNLNQYEFANLMVNELAELRAEFYLLIGKEPGKREVKKLNLQPNEFYDLAIDKLSSIEIALQILVAIKTGGKAIDNSENNFTDEETELAKLIDENKQIRREQKLSNIARMIQHYAGSSDADVEMDNNNNRMVPDGMIPELGISIKEAVENPQLLSEKLIKNFYERFGHYFENYRPGIPGQ